MTRTPLASLLLLICLSGCGRSVDPVTATSDSLAPALPQAYQYGVNTLSVAGVWTFTVDASTLEATLEPKPFRTAAQTDDTYALSVDRFFRPVHLRFTQIRGAGASISVSFDVVHPFPAPFNPEEPATGFGNRADLGFSGILALLGDVPTATGNTYFGDRVVNTAIMTNPHGYFSPEGLLPLSLTANTFPYRLIVHDELGGNRLGVAGPGGPRGNFGADGWTRAELGVNRTGWVGYNVLHQGQAAYISWRMTREYLEANGPVAIDLALFAKYNDPRGGATPDEKRANRLPPATPDMAIFGYRMPHGTWDVPQVIVRPEGGGFQANTVSSSLLRVSVEDFDALSEETTESDLSLEADPQKVNPGASGFPEIDVCIPGVLGGVNTFASFTPASDLLDDDSAYPDGDPGADTGRPYDLLFFEHLVEKPAGSGQSAGSYTGLVRVTDPEASLSTGYIALDPDLVPLGSNLPSPITYQAFSVTLAPGATGGSGWARLPGADAPVVAVKTVMVDQNDNVYMGGSYEGSLDFGGGTRTSDPFSNDSFIVSYTASGAHRWDRVWGNYEDEYVQDLTFANPAQTTLLAACSMYGAVDPGNGQVNGGGLHDILLVALNPADGAVQLASAEGAEERDWPLAVAVDSAGRLVLAGVSLGPTKIFDTDFDTDGQDPWIARGAAALNSLDYAQRISGPLLPQFSDMVVGTGDVVFVAGLMYGEIVIDGVTYPGLESDYTWLVRFGPSGSADWVKVLGDTTGTEGYLYASALALTVPGAQLLVTGSAIGTIDFGGGPIETAADDEAAFIARFDPSGIWQDEQWYGLDNGTADGFIDMDVMDSGEWLITGWYEDTLDLGGGTRSSQNSDGYTPFLLRTTSTGDYVWDAIWSGGGLYSVLYDVDAGPAGNIVLAGEIDGIFDGNPGAGEVVLDPESVVEGVVVHLPGTPGW